MKKYLLIGFLTGFCMSTVLYLYSSYFYEDLVMYIFNFRNKEEIEYMNEREVVINYFLNDLESIDLNDRKKIDSLATEHFENQFSDFNIVEYPNGDNELAMVFFPIDRKFSLIYVENDNIYSYINIRFNLK